MKRTLLILMPLMAFSNVFADNWATDFNLKSKLFDLRSKLPQMPNISVDTSKIVPESVKTIGGNLVTAASNVGAALRSVAVGSSEITKNTTAAIAKLAEKYPQAAAITVGLGATALTASSVAYAVYCRRWSNHWKTEIDLIKKDYTDYLSDLQAKKNNKPNNKLMFWAGSKDTFKRPQDIYLKRHLVYDELINMKKTGESTPEQTAARLAIEIESDREELKAKQKTLIDCLKESRFSPTLFDTDPWIISRVSYYVDTVSGVTDEKSLTKAQEDNITKALERDQSLLNPYNLFRRIAFPSEIAANVEYWKLSLLISRLNALYDVLKEKHPSLK